MLLVFLSFSNNIIGNAFTLNHANFFFFRFLTLKSGLNHLKQEENRRAADPLVFVKENVATFLDAVDTLKSIFTFFL